MKDLFGDEIPEPPAKVEKPTAAPKAVKPAKAPEPEIVFAPHVPVPFRRQVMALEAAGWSGKDVAAVLGTNPVTTTKLFTQWRRGEAMADTKGGADMPRPGAKLALRLLPEAVDGRRCEIRYRGRPLRPFDAHADAALAEALDAGHDCEVRVWTGAGAPWGLTYLLTGPASLAVEHANRLHEETRERRRAA